MAFSWWYFKQTAQKRFRTVLIWQVENEFRDVAGGNTFSLRVDNNCHTGPDDSTFLGNNAIWGGTDVNDVTSSGWYEGDAVGNCLIVATNTWAAL